MSDIILESCREVFQGSHGTETETNQITENEETEDQTETDDMTLRLEDENARQEEQVHMLLKRQRESMTPPNRDEKRKKDERPEVPTTSQTPQKQTNIQEGLPQRQKDEGKERARVSVKQREREGGPRSHSSSTSSTYKGTKSLCQTIFRL